MEQHVERSLGTRSVICTDHVTGHLSSSRALSVMRGQLSSSSTCKVSEHAPLVRCLIPLSVILSQWERACEINTTVKTINNPMWRQYRPWVEFVHDCSSPHLLVPPVQLMGSGIGQNAHCKVGEWLGINLAMQSVGWHVIMSVHVENTNTHWNWNW